MEITKQEENLIKKLRGLDESSLYEILFYVTPEKVIGFWVVKSKIGKVEGKAEGMKRDTMPAVAASAEREMA